MSSAVSGFPSDHLRFGRNVYVYVSPSSDAFHDSARPGIVLKSSAALSVSVAYWRFHSSYDATSTPTVTLGLSRSCVLPTRSTSFLLLVVVVCADAPVATLASAIPMATISATTLRRRYVTCPP